MRRERIGRGSEVHRTVQIFEDGSYALFTHGQYTSISIEEAKSEFAEIEEDAVWKDLHDNYGTSRLRRATIKKAKQDKPKK